MGLGVLEGRAWTRVRLIADSMVLIGACAVTAALRSKVSSEWLLVFFPPVTLLLLHLRGRYRLRLRDVALDNVVSGLGAVSISTLALFALKVLISGDEKSLIGFTAVLWLSSVAGITLAGLGLTTLQYAGRRRGLSASPTLIVGTDATARALADRLRARTEYGLRVVGFLDTDRADVAPGATPLLGTLEDLAAIATEHDIGHVIVCFPDAPDSELLALIALCYERDIETNVVPRLVSSINHDTRFEYLGTTPLLNLRATDVESRRFAGKYALDRVAAAGLLVALSPMMAAAAVAVRLSSRGPILFRQRRMGYDGRPFTLLKFRTMLDVDDRAPAFVPEVGLAPGGVEGSDRRTAVGRVLRRTAIDELPQLINVVRGEMSLVGPRPERPEFVELFCARIERYHDRHRVRSGMTGWAQVNGYRGQTSLSDRVEFDNFYIEHWSLTLDLKILLLTVPALLKAIWRGEASSTAEPIAPIAALDAAMRIAVDGNGRNGASHAPDDIAIRAQTVYTRAGRGPDAAGGLPTPKVVNRREVGGSGARELP